MRKAFRFDVGKADMHLFGPRNAVHPFKLLLLLLYVLTAKFKRAGFQENTGDEKTVPMHRFHCFDLVSRERLCKQDGSRHNSRRDRGAPINAASCCAMIFIKYTGSTTSTREFRLLKENGLTATQLRVGSPLSPSSERSVYLRIVCMCALKYPCKVHTTVSTHHMNLIAQVWARQRRAR